MIMRLPDDMQKGAIRAGDLPEEACMHTCHNSTPLAVSRKAIFESPPCTVDLQHAEC